MMLQLNIGVEKRKHLPILFPPFKIMEVQQMTVRLNTRVSDRLNEWLDKRSEEMGISKSALVAVAVENYMKETEVVQGIPKLIAELEKHGITID